MGENEVAKLWKRKCYVLVFAEGGTHLICFLNKAFHSWRPMDIWSYTRMVYASISSLLPNILLIDVTLLCWFRTCCTENTKRKKDTENNKCHSLNLKKKKENFHYLKKSGSHLWNAMITPCLCTEDVKKLCTQRHCPMWKANVYLFRRRFHKCMKCSLHMYPTSPLHFPKREIIYLSVYWFEDGKKKKKKKKTSIEERKLALGRNI